MAKSATTSLMIAGNPVQVTHETMATDDIKLNPENPRIRLLLKHRNGSAAPTHETLLKVVQEQPGYDSLQKAIRKAGGLNDPIIVQHDGVIVEGNSRGTAVKTLRAGNKSDERWKRVPVMRLPKDIPRYAVGLMMASYHIAGKTVWRPYAQADQIYQLHHVEKRSISVIADETRMSEREVEQYLEAYDYLINEVLPHMPAGGGSDILESKWSHALEFVKRKNLEGLRKDPKVRKQLAKLIVENKIKGAEVRNLDKVLKNRKASTALTDKGFKAAKAVLSKSDPAAASKLLKSMKAMTVSLGRMGQEDIAILKESEKAQAILNDLAKAIHGVAGIARVKLRV